jgi:hypothetical protein
MSGPERLDFLVYYRQQLQLIIGKLDRQIEKSGGANKVGDKTLMEDKKDLTDQKFLEAYADNPGLIEALKECRDFLRSISETEQDVDGRLYYANAKQGNRFAMIALSPRHLNLYFAPRLGLYENLPPEATSELRFGKSTGDRWDKFQLTTPFQVRKAISYLTPYFKCDGKQTAEAQANAGGLQNSGEE